MAGEDDVSQRTTLADAVAENAVFADDLQELRIGLVMSGGVSLAVWMGGVTQELNRLIRANRPGDAGDGTYLKLLRLTRSLPRIDVIAGTSAGGLNGALLAYAITQDAAVSGLRELWLELGALEALLRPPLVSNPPSLMRGDEYFLRRLESAITSLKNQLTKPDEVPMELMITTTLLNPWPHGVPDSLGTIIQDADHRGEFTFRRGTPAGDEEAPELADQFAQSDIAARLALAGRCSASFPLAFEASYAPVGMTTDDPARPDMKPHASFGQSRWVIDGGVLANQPLRPALRAIFRQPARKQVRRVLGYVVPDPGEAVKVEPDPLTPPTLGDVGLSAAIRLPRNQSVSADLEELTLHNTRVAANRRRRELMVVDLEDIDDLARQAYKQYRGFRADVIVGWLFRLLARGFAALEIDRPDLVGTAPLRERSQLRAELTRHLENIPPAVFPSPTADVEDWFTTVETAERAAGVLLDLLRRGLAVTDPGDKGDEARRQRGRLQALRGEICELIAAAQRTRRSLTRERELELAQAAVVALNAGTLGAWADQEVPQLLGDLDELRPIVRQIADRLPEAALTVRAACDSAPERLRAREIETRRFADGLVRGLGSTTPLHRLLALEVVQTTLGGEPIVEQRVDLVQISADAGNGLDDRGRAEEKLAGLQVAHFGAFYKRSWRANDWMWGRHDAAQRLAQILLEPARLHQLGYSVEGAVTDIKDIAWGGLEADDRQLLQTAGPRPWNEAIARDELGFLEEPLPGPRGPIAPPAIPVALPMCAQAVARRLQLEILREDELEQVSKAVTEDERAGAHMTVEALTFRDGYDEAPKPLAAATAVELFRACKVGEERIVDETASDLLARTAAQTVAVAAAALSGDRSGLPTRLRSPLKALRGLTMMMFLFVRHALAKQRAGATLATGALFAGAAVIGVGLIVKIPGVLMVLGVAALLGAVAVASLKKRLCKVLVALATGFVVALLPRLAGWITDAIDNDEKRADDVWKLVDRVEPVFVIAGLLFAAHRLGKLSILWPEDHEPEEVPVPDPAGVPR